MIVKLRKKTVVVESIQFKGTKDSFEEIWNWACPSNDTTLSPVHCGNDEEGADNYLVIYIQTLEGEMRADIGDWIIKGVKEEFYPCKPDIKDLTFEEVA